MATTFGKMPLRVAAPNDAYLGAVSVYYPEASSQTFLKNTPVKLVSGLVTVCGNPIVTTSTLVPVLGICLEDASGTAGTYLRVVPPQGGSLFFYANFLGAAAADNVLAAADLGGTFQMDYSATAINGDPGWYLEDTATNGGCTMTSFESDYPAPQNITTTRAAAGDTNARITGCFKAACLQLFI